MSTIPHTTTQAGTPAAGERKFTRARDLAARLGVCAKTLHRWADAGHVHRHKINARVVLFDESEVLAFIDRSKVPSAA